ncbi:MAG: hypothetical protein MMC33_008139 [Icmadophila ericetorum]|nr:hypothetical protein [Icmadophila ericetorum]
MSLAQYSINWATNLCGEAASFFHTSSLPKPSRTVIQNVHIWDGEKRIPNTSIVIEGQRISLTGDTSGAKIVNGNNGFLMPGLIDAHVHASNKLGLKTLALSGITTAFDMGSFPTSQMPQWHDVGEQGIASLWFSGAAACVDGGFPAILPGFPDDSIITSKERAKNYAQIRINEGVDFLKIFVNDEQLPKEEYQKIIKTVGEENDIYLVTHAPDFKAQEIARKVGGKFITHVPKEQTLLKEGVQEMLDKNQTAIPTLIMMQHLIKAGSLLGKPWEYRFANDSVALMYKMGVPILVGTDATKPGEGLVLYGPSMHTEMGLLHDAGMSNEDILRGATSLTAKHFRLTDRGKIAPGMRADLLLLTADPLEDISNSDKIRQIWTAGTAVKLIY